MSFEEISELVNAMDAELASMPAANATAFLTDLQHRCGALVRADALPHLVQSVLSGLFPKIKFFVFENCHQKFNTLLASAAHSRSEDYERLLVSHISDLFYSTCRPERLDLFGHLCAAELFFVDGDSLLTEALCSPLVDWTCTQPMLVVFLAEQLLSRLANRGGKFQVIFFDCHQWIWNDRPQFSLIRQLLVNHLNSSSNVEVQNFSNWWELKKSYKSYHSRFMPEFVLVNDGEQFPRLLGESIAADALVMYRAFFVSVVASRSHIVYTSRLCFRNNAALAFVVRAKSDRFVPAASCIPCLQEICTSLDSQHQSHSNEASSTAFNALMDLSESQSLKLAAREVLSIVAMVEVLKSNKQFASHAKAHVATLFVQKELSLADRALPQLKADEAGVNEVGAYLDALSTTLVLTFKSLTELVSPTEKIVDLFDGHLLAFVANELAKSSIEHLFQPDSARQIETLCTFVSKLSGCDLQSNITGKIVFKPPLPIFPATTVDPSQHHLLRSLFQSRPSVCPSWPVKDTCREAWEEEGVSELGQIIEKLKWQPQAEMIDLDEPAGLKAQAQFQATLNVKRSDKLANDFFRSIQATAESLDAKTFLHRNEEQCIVQDTGASKEKHKHSGQKKVATLSKAERIKRANVVEKAKTTAQQVFAKLHNLTGSLKGPLSADIRALEQFARDCTVTQKETVDESDEELEDEENTLEIWRALIEFSAQEEHAFVCPTSKNKLDLTGSLQCVERFTKTAVRAIRVAKIGLEDAIVETQALFFKYFTVHLRYQALFRSLSLAAATWRKEIEQSRDDHREIDIVKSVPLFQQINVVVDLLLSTGIRPNLTDRVEMYQALRTLDLPESYLKLCTAAVEESTGQPLPVQGPADPKTIPNIGHSPARFQLTQMGHLLARPKSDDSDKRVPFSPDPWQKELLDIVDNNGSAIVCAPTSAGKTFISYYCMKRVLRESNEHIVVYVCPTRALINQALADVYGRFGQKRYTDARFSGHQVFGCLGGVEFVKAPFKCQVLVTLPETLEALLLSPKYQVWARNIRYVIFDEIHSIENSGNGDVWERLLMIVRCPFVALSATLGETDQISAWLNRVQEKLRAQAAADSTQDFQVHLVPSGGKRISRWSDIRKYAFLTTPTPAFKNVNTCPRPANDALLSIHPMSCVTLDMLRSKFPEDLPFVPGETVDLYDNMCTFFDSYLGDSEGNPIVSWSLRRLRELKPERYFANRRTITQTEAREFETEVKTLLRVWGQFSNGNFPAPTADDATDEDQRHVKKYVAGCLRDLLDHYKSRVSEQENAVAEAAEKAINEPLPDTRHPDTFAFVKENMLGLLCALKHRELLPTLVFSFEESDCEAVVEFVVNQLEVAEAAYRETSKFRTWAAERELKAKQQQERLSRMERGANRVKEVGEDGKVTVRTDEIVTVDEVKDYSIPDVLPEFSFASIFDQVSKEDMDGIVYDMKQHPLAFRAFQRGIGMHHPGVKGKLRIHVERLFRRKHLPIVFATETLALGVHSPCRSVVLAGDNVYLNTMQFRQMAGRAGRRGLDFLGHCVFLGVSHLKIQRLMTSNMNCLKGHVHIDPTVELRLLQLYDHDDSAERVDERVDKATICKIADCLLTTPLFYEGRRACDFESLQANHFRFMTEYFIREGLIRRNRPSTLGSLTTRALNSYREAKGGIGSFVLASLITSEFLHDLTHTWSPSAPVIHNAPLVEHVLSMLCYLFTIDCDFGIPMEVHRSVTHDPTVFYPEFPTAAPTAVHDVVLPPLNTVGGIGGFGRQLSVINRRVVGILTNLLISLGQQLPPPDATLPYAAYKKGKPILVCPATSGSGDEILRIIQSSKQAVHARNPFLAISGHGDRFLCVEDLCGSLRDGLFLDPQQVPTLDFIDFSHHSADQVLVNAAIADFLDNGSQIVDGAPQRQYLEQFNGLSPGKSWYTLVRFSTVVENLITQLENVVPGEKTPSGLDTQDTFVSVLQQIVAKLEEVAVQFHFKFADAKRFTEAQNQVQQQTQKKPKRPALVKEVRRRRF